MLSVQNLFFFFLKKVIVKYNGIDVLLKVCLRVSYASVIINLKTYFTSL